MTIREHFRDMYKRVSRWTTAVAFIAAAVMWMYPQLNGFVIGLVIAVPLIGVLFAFRGRFRCPRCGAELSKLRRQEIRQRGFIEATLDRRLFWDAWNACPKCGVSFDEDYGPIGS